jgi:hypothetical protein
MKPVKVRPLDLGQYPTRLPARRLANSAEWVAAALAVIWVVAVLGYVWRQPAQDLAAPSVLVVLVVVFLPLSLIFGVLITLRSVRALRDEAARLQTSVDAMRKAFLTGQSHIDPAMQPVVARKLNEIAEQTLQTQATIANIAERVEQGRMGQARLRNLGAAVIAPPDAPTANPEEPPLALETVDPKSAPLTAAQFIKAINFPDGPEDTQGFAAMRAALANREIAKLIRAAQEVLTLLAQDGIYMDELKHSPAPPDVWRRFAGGLRGREIAALGGVRDRTALTLTMGRLRNDPPFRSAAHNFLRDFDRVFVAFEPKADDSDLALMGTTRTARAFMLLGRVLGMFDG